MSAIVQHPSFGRLSALGLPGSIGPTFWRLPEIITESDWLDAGSLLARMHDGIGWWIGDWWNAYKPEWGERAQLFENGWEGPAYTTCRNCQAVCDAFDIARRRANLPFSHHVEVADLPLAEADMLLDWAEINAASVRELRAEIAKRRQQHVIADMSLPSGQFPLLLADPPWRYENPPMGGSNRSIENHYPTMSLDDICALPVRQIAADNALLYLWATAPKLAECFAVIDAWGFTYRTNIVWVKDKIGMGYHARSQHELLLIAKRGELPPPLPEARESSVIVAKRGKHSEKPPAFYELIERWYPTLAKVELFARRERDGWTGYGNQLTAAT